MGTFYCRETRNEHKITKYVMGLINNGITLSIFFKNDRCGLNALKLSMQNVC